MGQLKIALSKNVFQSMGELKNCCLKKYISKLLFQKTLLIKKRFSLTSMNKKTFSQNTLKYEEILQKSNFFL